MKVFISWSGPESKQIAQALRDWLPEIFESVDSYMSARDNGAGVRWSTVIASELEGSDFGILCCTASNLTAPWLNFEAGALSKAVDTARVVPLLHNLSPSDIGSPLSEFMAVRDDEAGLWEIVKALNTLVDRPRDEAVLRRVFQRAWPDLETKFTSVVPSAPPTFPHRSERELLEEVLELLREQARTIDRTRLAALFPTARATVPEAVVARVERLIKERLGVSVWFEQAAEGTQMTIVVPAELTQDQRAEVANIALHDLNKRGIRTVAIVNHKEESTYSAPVAHLSPPRPPGRPSEIQESAGDQ